MTQDKSKYYKDNFNLTTIVVKGMNHYQFSGQGEPPSFVKQNDIESEISDEDARAHVSLLISSFMQIVLNRNTDEEVNTLKAYLNDTKSLVQDLIDAFELEGSYHLSQPCLAVDQHNCTPGSQWTERAQAVMGGLDHSYNITDAFRHSSKVPEQFPSLNNKCQPPTPCTLIIDTVSEIEYSLEDSFDTGLQPQAGSEIRAKMMSRQAIILAATGNENDFNLTDGQNCGQINGESIVWALLKAPKATLDRYISKGVQLAIGDDVNGGDGPFWLYNPLSIKKQLDPVTGKTMAVVSSPTMKFPVDYSVKNFQGFHYCKLLSPARALEWLYVDSLKP